MLDKSTVKNVSIPQALFDYMGAAQAKLSESYPPWRWGNPAVLVPHHDEQTLLALRLAVSLFDEGRDRSSRLEFARLLGGQYAMRYAWYRSLVVELNK
jgi:hypothetical protein